MTFHSEFPVHFWGISVKGPHHVLHDDPNQDAWLGKHAASGTIIAVCDGMGSRMHSEIGSQLACQAVSDAVRIWTKTHNTNTDYLLQLIELLWHMYLPEDEAAEYATTCLFAAVFPTGNYIVAGLGDGMAVVKHADGAFIQLLKRTHVFGNTTIALGISHSLDDWRLFTGECFGSGTQVFLATDGIADDLKPDRVTDFIDWLIEQYGSLEPRKRYWQLKHALVDWPTPKHQDDKTLAVVYSK